MLRLQVLGHLGKDAVMSQHGTDNVLNFTVAHTNKYKGSDGLQHEKTTWVECSWWIDSRNTVGQWLKKGTKVWVDGIPDSRPWETRDGKKASSLILRVYSLELCGSPSNRDNNQQPSQQAPASAPVTDQGGYKPIETENFDDLPF